MKTGKIHTLFILLITFSFISCNQKKVQKTQTKSSIQKEIVLDLVDLQSKKKLGKDTIITIINDPVYHKVKKYKAVINPKCRWNYF